MQNYFIRGAQAACPNPKCRKHRFAGPAKLRPGSKVKCLNCGEVCIVEYAIRAVHRKIRAEKARSN